MIGERVGLKYVLKCSCTTEEPTLCSAYHWTFFHLPLLGRTEFEQQLADKSPLIANDSAVGFGQGHDIKLSTMERAPFFSAKLWLLTSWTAAQDPAMSDTSCLAVGKGDYATINRVDVFLNKAL